MPGPTDPFQLFADLQRMVANLLRVGTIAAVDPTATPPRVRVKLTENTTTDWRPYFELRTGETRTWNPPTVGEPVMLLSPNGLTEGGYVLAGIPTEGHPPPSNDPNKTVTRYPDGMVIEYDHAAHKFKATLPADGTADIDVPDAITVTCKTADVTASESATVHSQQITLDAPQTTTTGHLTVMGLTSMMGGFAAYGTSTVPGSQGTGRMNIPLLSTREIETTSTIHADTDVTAGAISLKTHPHGEVQSGGDVSGGPL
ncbi:MAG: phage baseplate assembly protein V [Pseudacidovorax sp.]|uniref:phage baseplate assembly protein V n=1 Tax=Pseudacidovorax sp. TaxID=1934311 RepID=UPI001B46EB61|nr:phage baseplate assembly protein V [Pseudacidovorax sp.]MBP6894330.1 phage baseplate assembly protein V [Pseudacidovorax sp.]